MPARWYRSLYWRIALGFVLCLAAMLVVQALLFIWVASRSGPTVPGQPPDRFARTVAQELAQAFERDPALNVGEFLREQYGREAHPLFVLLADGREFNNGGGPAPEALLAMARARLRNGLTERVPSGGPPRGPMSGLGRSAGAASGRFDRVRARRPGRPSDGSWIPADAAGADHRQRQAGRRRRGAASRTVRLPARRATGRRWRWSRSARSWLARCSRRWSSSGPRAGG